MRLPDFIITFFFVCTTKPYLTILYHDNLEISHRHLPLCVAKLYNLCHWYGVHKEQEVDSDSKESFRQSIGQYFGNIFARKWLCARTSTSPKARVSTPITSQRRQSSFQRVCRRSGRRLIVPRDAQHATDEQFADNWYSFILIFCRLGGWIRSVAALVSSQFSSSIRNRCLDSFKICQPIVFYYYTNIL